MAVDEYSKEHATKGGGRASKQPAENSPSISGSHSAKAVITASKPSKGKKRHEAMHQEVTRPTWQSLGGGEEKRAYVEVF